MDATSRTRELLGNLIRLRGYSISEVAARAGARKSHLADFLAAKPRGSVSTARLEVALSTVGWVAGRLDRAQIHHWRSQANLTDFIESIVKPDAWDAVPVFPDAEGPMEHFGVLALWIDGARIVLTAGSGPDDLATLDDILARARKARRPSRPGTSPFNKPALIIKNPKTWQRWVNSDLSPMLFDEAVDGRSVAATQETREVPAIWADFATVATIRGHSPESLEQLLERELDIRAATDPTFEEWLLKNLLRPFEQDGLPAPGKRIQNSVRKAAANETKTRRAAGIALLEDLLKRVGT